MRHDWGYVTGRLGEPLPTDFMQFIDAYGSVELNSHVVVFNPFSQSANINFFEGAFSSLAVLRTIKNEFPDCIPEPLYFEKGGLLPWGFSTVGDIYCWVTQGISGTWKIAVVCRDGDYEAFAMTMTQFLARVFTGKIRSESIPYETIESGKIVCRRLDVNEATG